MREGVELKRIKPFNVRIPVPAGDHYLPIESGHKLHIRAEKEGGFLIADGTRVFRLNSSALFYAMRILQDRTDREIASEAASIFSADLFTLRADIARFRRELREFIEMERLPPPHPAHVLNRIFPLRVVFRTGSTLPGTPEDIVSLMLLTGTTILEMRINELFPETLRLLRIAGERGLYTVLRIPISGLTQETDIGAGTADEVRLVQEKEKILPGTLQTVRLCGSRVVSVLETALEAPEEAFRKLRESGILEIELPDNMPDNRRLKELSVKSGLLPLRKRRERGAIYLDPELNVLRRDGGEVVGQLQNEDWSTLRKRLKRMLN